MIDLESKHLEIKTDSTLGSGDEIDVDIYNSQGDYAGSFRISFFSTAQYKLYWCTSNNKNFPNNLPTVVDKVWRISLTKTSGIRLQIYCNDVEVLNFLLSDETCDKNDWRKNWSRDVERIAFYYTDTASDFYRPFTPGRKCM